MIQGIDEWLSLGSAIQGQKKAWLARVVKEGFTVYLL